MDEGGETPNGKIMSFSSNFFHFSMLFLIKQIVCFGFFLACNRFNGLNFIVDCCAGCGVSLLDRRTTKKTNWAFFLQASLLTADPHHKLVLQCEAMLSW